MIRHIVLLKVPTHTSSECLNTMFAALQGLQATIPEIKAFYWGVYQSPEQLNCDYNYGFTMDFQDAAGRDYYLNHPDHIRVAQELVLPFLSDGVNSALAFDFEFTP